MTKQVTQLAEQWERAVEHASEVECQAEVAAAELQRVAGLHIQSALRAGQYPPVGMTAAHSLCRGMCGKC
jgi:hypothetical protein